MRPCHQQEKGPSDLGIVRFRPSGRAVEARYKQSPSQQCPFIRPSASATPSDGLVVVPAGRGVLWLLRSRLLQRAQSPFSYELKSCRPFQLCLRAVGRAIRVPQHRPWPLLASSLSLSPPEIPPTAPTMALTQSPLLYVVAGALLSYVIYSRIQLYLARQRLIKQNGCQPCAHRFNKDPILGWDVVKANVANYKARRMLERNRRRFLDQNTHTYLNKTLDVNMIVTCEPENIKTLLSLKFKDYSFGNRRRAFSPLLGDGIFNSDGEKWANSRHLLRPNFARDQIADLDAFERHFKLMMKHIPKDGSTVDLQALFFKLTIDSATEFLFNHSTDSLRMSEDEVNNEDAIFARAFQFAQEDIITRLRWNLLDPLRPNKAGKDALRICHAYVDKFVDIAMKEHDEEKATGKADDEGRYVFIKELVKQTGDKTRIRDELMNILLAGRDTTASLLSNMFFQFALRPDVWAKLRAEVATLEGRQPTYEELRNLKYLKWCLNECKSNPLVSA